MNQESVFTKIINKELPATVLFENDTVIVIETLQKEAPFHILGIPKTPYKDVDELVKAGDSAVLWELFSQLVACAHAAGIGETGYRILTNTGPDAHQVVQHLHFHLIGGAYLQINDPVKP